MIWSTGGSVTDSIWRYRDIGHVINTPCYHVFFRSFAVLSFELYVQSIVRVLRLLNPCEIQRNALQRYLSLHTGGESKENHQLLQGDIMLI